MRSAAIFYFIRSLLPQAIMAFFCALRLVFASFTYKTGPIGEGRPPSPMGSGVSRPRGLPSPEGYRGPEGYPGLIGRSKLPNELEVGQLLKSPGLPATFAGCPPLLRPLWGRGGGASGGGDSRKEREETEEERTRNRAEVERRETRPLKS